MKKILFYVCIAILFLSVFATITNGNLIIYDLNRLLSIVNTLPLVDFSGVYTTFADVSNGILANLPFIGFIFKALLNVSVVVVMLCEFMLKILTFVIYLLPSLFGVV